MPSRTAEATDSLSNSADIVSRFLALEQIYSAREFDTYLQSHQKATHALESEPQPVDVIVLCASAILAIPEAVFEWAVQQYRTHPDAQQRNMVLILSGGVGPCTSFVYDAIKASKKYCQMFEDINGKPEGQVLRVMAERIYKLKINRSAKGQSTDESLKERLRLLVADRSTNCGVDALQTRQVLDSHGIHSPRSIVVVQDPAMISRTVSSFEDVYDDKEAQVFSWPERIPGKLGQEFKFQTSGYRKGVGKELWSMDRFLDRVLGESLGLDDGRTPRYPGSNAQLNIPNEVEDAWSTIMGKGSSTPST
ncbi:hypothetical protein NW762_003642 [Fusarium torreyae]|uniref:DUF218 domain-containing protein n=1 Tax=Fusarium torreyae TaxID=1237075 RepID=A0A9W8S959_9HYPO|nr:hypothetical protein NW762_003642 [Fusarium torreyae]